jgi:hypothetical protein
MGRRHAMWWRHTRAWHSRPSAARARVAVVGALLLAATAALPGGPAFAAGTPAPYGFAADARPVTGSPDTTDAELLKPGTTYKSSLPAGVKTYYRLQLDARSTAYVSATAVPAPTDTVRVSDGLKVSVQDTDGHICSSPDSQTFGSVRGPRPLTAWGMREVTANRTRCAGSGTYYVVVERVGTTASSTPPSTGSPLDPSAGASLGASQGSSGDPLSSADASQDGWGLELFVTSEPPLLRTPGTRAPEAWNSASPRPLTGTPVTREGGAGFASAVAVEEGAWRSGIEPGQTVFYKVPVDWGRQLRATAELGSSSAGRGYTFSALNLALYNPVRGYVDDAHTSYNGSQRSVTLDPLPPVAYENRYAARDRESGMRFAGSYYLVVHLSAAVADKYGDGPFGLVLRVGTDGTATAGPGYAGEARPAGVIATGGGDQGTAAGRSGTEAGVAGGSDPAMKILAVSGIGTGTALLLILGVWTAVARRNAAQMRVSAQKPTT